MLGVHGLIILNYEPVTREFTILLTHLYIIFVAFIVVCVSSKWEKLPISGPVLKSEQKHFLNPPNMVICASVLNILVTIKKTT